MRAVSVEAAAAAASGAALWQKVTSSSASGISRCHCASSRSHSVEWQAPVSILRRTKAPGSETSGAHSDFSSCMVPFFTFATALTHGCNGPIPRLLPFARRPHPPSFHLGTKAQLPGAFQGAIKHNAGTWFQPRTESQSLTAGHCHIGCRLSL